MPEPRPKRFDPAHWAQSEDWRSARELFDAGFWWESHEWLEGLWRAFGRDTAEGRLMKALVQVAAAQLRMAVGSHAGGRRLARRARAALDRLPSPLLGVDVDELRRRVGALTERADEPLRIPMAPPAGSAAD